MTCQCGMHFCYLCQASFGRGPEMEANKNKHYFGNRLSPCYRKMIAGVQAEDQGNVPIEVHYPQQQVVQRQLIDITQYQRHLMERYVQERDRRRQTPPASCNRSCCHTGTGNTQLPVPDAGRWHGAFKYSNMSDAIQNATFECVAASRNVAECTIGILNRLPCYCPVVIKTMNEQPLVLGNSYVAVFEKMVLIIHYMGERSRYLATCAGAMDDTPADKDYLNQQGNINFRLQCGYVYNLTQRVALRLKARYEVILFI